MDEKTIIQSLHESQFASGRSVVVPKHVADVKKAIKAGVFSLVDIAKKVNMKKEELRKALEYIMTIGAESVH